MTVGFCPEPPFFLPLPPNRPFTPSVTLSFKFVAPSSTALRMGPLPSASFLPPSRASLAKPGLRPSAMSVSLLVLSPSLRPAPTSSRSAWAMAYF